MGWHCCCRAGGGVSIPISIGVCCLDKTNSNFNSFKHNSFVLLFQPAYWLYLPITGPVRPPSSVVGIAVDLFVDISCDVPITVNPVFTGRLCGSSARLYSITLTKWANFLIPKIPSSSSSSSCSGVCTPVIKSSRTSCRRLVCQPIRIGSW